MSKVYDTIDTRLASWIAKQQMFFVATAPLSSSGHVSCSPKGGDSFRVLGPNEVVYQDYVGSGAETISHVQENGRIVIMFCAFEGRPNIVRLHGRATIHLKGQARYEELVAHFPEHSGTRSVIHIDVTRISDSCGYAVPLYDFVGPREVLDKWCENKGEEGVETYIQEMNHSSIDGLPGVPKKD